MLNRLTPNKKLTASSATVFGLFVTLFAFAVTKAEEASLQDIAKAMQALPQIVLYPAREIVTLDPEKPTVQAVAVDGCALVLRHDHGA